MRHSKSIISFFICLIFLFHSNVSKATSTENWVVDGILTDTTDMSENSVWYFTGTSILCNDPVYMVSVVRTVVVGDRVCRVLRVSMDDLIYPESEWTVYYKDKRMYFYENDEWKILYDFNLNVGDTLDYHLPEVNGNYGFGADPTIQYQMVVNKIDTVYANNGWPLRRLYTKRTSEIVENEGFNVSIESVGSILGLFGLHANVITEGCFQSLRCFQNDDYLYQLNSFCGPSSSTQPLKTDLNMVPNPGTDFIHISLPEGVQYPINYQVTTIMGKEVLRGLSDASIFDIKTDELSSATYIVRCSDKSGHQWFGKWVKM